MSNIKRLKQSILNYSKLAYNQGLFSGTSGNISAFDPENGYVVITPTSIAYSSMKIDDIVVIDLSGKQIDGQCKPSSEWRMHNSIYQARNGVFAVFHTHSPYATSFSVTKKDIPLILTEMFPSLGENVPVAEFARPGTVEMGTEALKAMTNANACLLCNHGVLTVGRTVEQAYTRAIYVEDVAKTYYYALTSGFEINLLPDDYIQNKTTMEVPSQTK